MFCLISWGQNWDKGFKNGPSKICRRQPLKNLKGRVLCNRILLPPFLISYIFNIGLPQHGWGQRQFFKIRTSKTAISLFLANFLTIYFRLNTNTPVLFIEFCLRHTWVTITSYHLSSCFLRQLCHWSFYCLSVDLRYFLKAQHDPMGRTLLVERVESCKENQLVNRNNNLPNIYI